MDKSPNRRRRIYIDRHIQGGIVARLIVLWAASAALAGGLWFCFAFLANPTLGCTQYLADARAQVLPLLLAYAATLPIAILHVIRFTHRFAGPLVRLRKMMFFLAEGQNVPTLEFRKLDYWHDLAANFNRVSERLADAQQRIVELETRLQRSGAFEKTNQQELEQPVSNT